MFYVYCYSLFLWLWLGIIGNAIASLVRSSTFVMYSMYKANEKSNLIRSLH